MTLQLLTQQEWFGFTSRALVLGAVGWSFAKLCEPCDTMHFLARMCAVACALVVMGMAWALYIKSTERMKFSATAHPIFTQ